MTTQKKPYKPHQEKEMHKKVCVTAGNTTVRARQKDTSDCISSAMRNTVRKEENSSAFRSLLLFFLLIAKR